jgi:trehalose/maltose hydrolase-like predicted phosphorylase
VVDRIDPDDRGAFLGNGTLGLRVRQQGTGWWHPSTTGREEAQGPGRASSEAFPAGPLPAFMAGLYEDEHLVTVPAPTAIDLVVGDRHFMADPGHIRNFRQTLSLREGVLTTEADWDTGAGNLRVAIRTLVARHDPHLSMVELRLRAGKAMELRLLRASEPGGDFEGATWSVRDDSFELQARTRQGGVRFAQVDRLLVGDSPVAPGNASPSEIGERRVPLSAASEVVVTRFVGTANGRDVADPLAAARKSVATAASGGGENLFAQHREAWARLWESDIEIEGAPKDQLVARTLLFYLRQNARPGGDASIPPMGLTGDAFGGHIFWDAETWIFPALLAFHPEMARPLLDYRYRTLPAARANAHAEGMPGASYAWESAATGTEQGPEPYRNGRHVTADIALAVWQYYAATGDRGWLAERGWPILQATAEYWVGRASRSGGRFGIKRVTTPDENAGIVDNSAWVNFAARRNLEISADVGNLLGRPVNPRWLQVAKGLTLPRDPQTGLIREHDSYRGVKIKQADTLLLLFPGGLSLPAEEQARLYDYYAPRAIEVGPAMTDSIHAIIAARLGRADEAYRQFRDSYEPFLRPHFLLFSEKRTRDNLYFLTGAAGTLQSILYGFGGLRLGDADQPTEKALLPPPWKSLTLRGVSWQGRRYDRVVRAGQKAEWRAAGKG